MNIMAQMGHQMNPSQLNQSDDGSSIKVDQTTFGASGGREPEAPGLHAARGPARANVAHRGHRVPKAEHVVIRSENPKQPDSAGTAQTRAQDAQSMEATENARSAMGAPGMRLPSTYSGSPPKGKASQARRGKGYVQGFFSKFGSGTQPREPPGKGDPFGGSSLHS